MKSWNNTLFHHFKIPTRVALGLPIDKTYYFNNVQVYRPLAQYIHAIMWYNISCNIVNIANQLFFANQRLTPKLRVFIIPSTKSIKISDFIHASNKKQKVWQEIITTLETPYQYYNPAQRLSLFRPPFLSQSKPFLCFQTQQCIPPFQLS